MTTYPMTAKQKRRLTCSSIFEEQATALGGSQQRHAVIATKRDEVQASAAVMAMKTFGHAEMLARRA